MGIGVADLEPKEKAHRVALLTITIADDILRIVSEKIIRGCEYKLNGGAYVEAPLRVKICFVHDKGAEDLTAFLEKIPASSLGPGFEIRRGQAGAEEGVHIVLYRITIWGTLKIYAAIDEQTV
jgi:hypothetical protein